MKSLHELGLLNGTDKAHFHNFTPLYDEHFSSLRNKKLNFLELGVELGRSLKMWEEYFINSNIYGCDIMEESQRKHLQMTAEDGKYKDLTFDDRRTKIFVTNQEKKEDLLKLPDNLDIIIDDGGHTMLQQQLTLSVLFDKLNNGGFYVIEDLHTSYYPDYGATDTNNTIRLLNDLKNQNISPNSEYFISNDDFNDLLKKISDIQIYIIKNQSITSIIRKK